MNQVNLFGSIPVKSYSIVMEFADNGDLFQRITDCQKNGTWLNESDVWHIFIQTVRGLRALHDLKILHRDMKVLLTHMVECKCVFVQR